MDALDAITPVDGYKLGHVAQFPEHMDECYSNFTSRGSRIEGIEDVTFLGLQPAIQQHLMDDLKEFFEGDIDEICQEYTDLMNEYLGPNNHVGTQHIRDWHDLGFTPLEFKALPEGTQVPLRVPMFTVRSTHGEKYSWLANYFETILSASIWMPCTSATTARRFRKVLEKFADLTGSSKEFIDWQGHDFSFRGMAGLEAAKMSASGHLIYFCGTDTVPAIRYIKKYYGVPNGYLLAGSVPATEHSVMCAGGEENELDTFNRLLDIYPTGFLSVVSDTWDLWKIVGAGGVVEQLKDRIMSRDGRLICRPDSGIPELIICGNPDAPVGSSEYKGVIECLYDIFGGSITDKGYKVLDSHIGCIYGDSIGIDRARIILERLAWKGYAANNIVFGIGSWTYQLVTRDVYNSAMKATNVIIGGVSKAIFKKPKTDNGMKNSAKGYLAVMPNIETGKPELINEANPRQLAMSLLHTVWIDGRWVRTQTFDNIREIARSTM
jgi:nicotinamide phosphoribosyltransferase